ncbi:hypothetical protein ABBQ32_001640 [Trebouxia sp. C0010 RCD-2024]
MTSTPVTQVLNHYIDCRSKGQTLIHRRICFHIANASRIRTLEVDLPANGSLVPLFTAFGLISAAEINTYQPVSGTGCSTEESDVDFLQWLSTTVAQAAKSAEEHEVLCATSQSLIASIENQFKLSHVVGSSSYAQSTVERAQHVEALKALHACLTDVCQDEPDKLEGLSIYLHQDSTSDTPIQTHVAEDGSLVLLVDSSPAMKQDLLRLDLEQARLLTCLSHSWRQQVKEATALLQDMLQVEDVWFLSQGHQASQEFVQWAGKVLQHRETYQKAVQARQHAFKVLVHQDHFAPALEFADSFGALQVTTECRPQQLLEYLRGEAATAASAAAANQDRAKAEEDRLLEAARMALGVQHIIRICSRNDQPSVTAPLQRLIQHGPTVRQAVDLSGITIAIDDRYEVWGSGIISIPWNFRMQDLKPQLLKLLGPAVASEAASCSYTLRVSLRSSPARQRVASFTVAGFGRQPVAQNHLRGTLLSLGNNCCAKAIAQQQTRQLSFCVLGSYAPRQCKRYALRNSSQCLIPCNVPVRFRSLAPSCMHGFSRVV